MDAELLPRHLCEVLIEDAERAFGRVVEAGDQIQQSGLPRSGRADQGEKLPLLNGERHAVERPHHGLSHVVVLFQVAGFEQ